jgi:DNA-directed RNA polymerase specialized sigma24 family protein
MRRKILDATDKEIEEAKIAKQQKALYIFVRDNPGLSNKEVAEKMSTTFKNVGAQLSAASKKIDIFRKNRSKGLVALKEDDQKTVENIKKNIIEKGEERKGKRMPFFSDEEIEKTLNLTDLQKEVIFLRRDHDYQEIATLKGLTLEQVNNQVTGAAIKIRRRIEKESGIPAGQVHAETNPAITKTEKENTKQGEENNPLIDVTKLVIDFFIKIAESKKVEYEFKAKACSNLLEGMSKINPKSVIDQIPKLFGLFASPNLMGRGTKRKETKKKEKKGETAPKPAGDG